MSDLIEMWQVAARITRFVLDGIPPEHLADKLGARAWTVGQHFAHVHNNRRDWLAGYPDLQAEVVKASKDQFGDKAILQHALNQSAAAMAQMLERAIAKGKVSGVKRPPAVFVGYLVAHESYHISEISVILAQNGHRLPNAIAWGIWEWDQR
jgi:uncharacterized damage-inducible protein DinB